MEAAIAEDQSFSEREVESLRISKSDVEMRFHIPAGAEDFLVLTSEELSYSPSQTEALINRNMLSYISNVMFDKPNHAIVDAILIPKSIYDV